jgi:hypothetical protein
VGERASAWTVPGREREGRAGRQLGEIELTGGPGLSAGGRERGKGKFHFLFFFKYIFPLAFFQMNF